MMEMREPFRGFEARVAALERRLAQNLESDSSKESTLGPLGWIPPVDEALKKILDPRMFEEEMSCFREVTRRKVDLIDELVEAIVRREESIILDLEAREKAFAGMVEATIARMRIELDAFDAFAANQARSAWKRLQELMFECIGESEKTFERLERIADMQASNLFEEHAQVEKLLPWRLQLLKLEEDSFHVLSVSDLSPNDHSEIFSKCSKFCGRTFERKTFAGMALVSHKSRKGVNAVNARRSSLPKYSRREGLHGTSESEKKRVLEEVFLDAGIAAAESCKTSKNPANLLPRFPVDMPLSNRPVLWMVLQSFGTLPSDFVVYFCLEERSLACRKSESSRAESFRSIYVGKNENWNAKLDSLRSGKRVKVVDLDKKHRLADVGLASCGRVVKTADPQLHFAPASVQELLESTGFMENINPECSLEERIALQEAYPHVSSCAIESLFIRMGEEMVELPKDVVLELCKVFICRKTQHNEAALVEGIGDIGSCFPESKFLSPLVSTNERIALLVHFEEREMSSSAEQVCENNENLCRWRGCNVVSVKRAFCKFHFDAHKFLVENQPNGLKEAKRYLSKHSLPNRSFDVESGVQASSLVSELHSGKLFSTVYSFCEKSCSFLSKKMEAKAASAIERKKEAVQGVNIAKMQLTLAEMVKHVEKEVTNELLSITRSGEYPFDELEKIREEHEMLTKERGKVQSRLAFLLNEFQDLIGALPNLQIQRELGSPGQVEAETELAFSLRKLSILRHRRVKVLESERPAHNVKGVPRLPISKKTIRNPRRIRRPPRTRHLDGNQESK